MSEETKSVHVIVSGRVQGVWYRAWVREKASDLGLHGWVRNLRSGDVEAVFSGPSHLVEDMLNALWDGSPLSKVKDVTSRHCAKPAGEGFEILKTA